MTDLRLTAYLHKVAKSGRLHLRVRQSMYSDDLKARLHRIGSPATWNQAAWEWDYPLTAAAVVALHRVSDETGIPIDWSADLVEFATEQKRIEDYEKSVRLSIEKIIRDKTALPGYVTNTFDGTKNPMFHQQVSFHWGVRSTGLYLAHEPGLGKTRSGCDIIRGWYDLKLVRPMQQVWLPAQGRWGVRGGVVVVCPNGLQRTWCKELMQWQGMTGIEVQGGSRAKKTERAGMLGHVHLINYESLHIVLGNEYDGLVSDEAHRCANNSTQTERVLGLAQSARRRLLLSGTPITNDLESAFYPMLICDGGRSLGSSKTAFLEEYFTAEPVGPGRTKNVPKDGAVEAVSKAMARCTYFLRKSEAIDLPPKTHTPIYLSMTAEQQRYYESLKKETLTYIQDATVTIEQAVSRMMKLRQVCQGHVIDDDGKVKTFSSIKVDTLVDMLTNEYAHRKVVVWGVFTEEINRLCAALQARGVGHVRMDGQVKAKKDRDAALQYWNNDDRMKVFVGQIQLGIGLTLHANECTVPCYDCIYLGIDYSYVNWVQSQDRIHRIGQKYACSYKYLLTEDGIDSNIYKALLAKADMATAVHLTGKEFFKSLILGDVPALAALDAA